MQKIIVLFFIVVLFANNTSANQLRKRNTYVSLTIAEAFYSDFVVDEFNLKNNRHYFEADIFPLNFLSTGVFYSPKFQRGTMSESKNHYYGIKLGLHAYPLFEGLSLNYLKDRLDIYASFFVQNEVTKHTSFYTFDLELKEHVKLDEASVWEQSRIKQGLAIGASYYFINNAGITLEYKFRNNNLFNNYLKLGLTFRL